MSSINLSTDQSMQNGGQRAPIMQAGMVVIAIILFIVTAISGGLIIWRNSLNGKVATDLAAYDTKSKALMSNPRNNDIVDFQSRLSLGNELVAQDNVALVVLQDIEKDIVAGVHLTSYKIDVVAKTLKLEYVADNYESVAKQSLNLKKSIYFSDVFVDNAGISTEGKNTFSVNLKLN